MIEGNAVGCKGVHFVLIVDANVDFKYDIIQPIHDYFSMNRRLLSSTQQNIELGLNSRAGQLVSGQVDKDNICDIAHVYHMMDKWFSLCKNFQNNE